jgi:hypothetical protein
MQPSVEAELQAVIAAGRALSKAALAAKDERAAAIAAVTRGLSYPVLPSRLPRVPQDTSPVCKAAPLGIRRREAAQSLSSANQKPASPLKLSMAGVNGAMARNADAEACGSGDWLLAAEHGSPIARPPLCMRCA